MEHGLNSNFVVLYFRTIAYERRCMWSSVTSAWIEIFVANPISNDGWISAEAALVISHFRS